MKRIPAVSWRSGHAQSMVEVVIFGATIILLIAAIVQNVVTTSFAQQYAFRTMRESMTKSNTENHRYTKASMQRYPYSMKPVRKPYNLIVIEDRLFPVVSKYGATERTPYYASSNAVLTPDLFRDPDFWGMGEVPVLNLKLNDQKRFYTMGKWVAYGGTTCELAGGGTGVLKDIIKARGRALCLKDTYPAPVFMKNPSDPPEYWMFDPTQGDFNPFDPDQGLKKDMSIVTTNDAKLTVPAAGTGSTYSNKQKDVVKRYFKKNSGLEIITSTINYHRTHAW